FFDEMSNESGNEKYYTAISSYAKSTDGFSITFGNAGTDVPESYIGTVDTIEIYEDSGSTATLSSATIKNPTFTHDTKGNYQLDLVLTDSSGATANAPQATITVTSPPPPLSVSINAPTSGTTGTLVTLGATVSNGHSPYTYAWTLTAPAGSTATLSSATDPAPTFTPDIAGSYQLDLTVTDSSNTKSLHDAPPISVTSPPPPLSVSINAPTSGTTGTL